MKELKLSNSNKIGLVDDEDYEYVLSHNTKWHFNGNGIWTRSLILPRKGTRRQKISLHRAVLRDFTNIGDIDHIDRNPLNNQKSNLRLVAHKQNLLNVGKWNNVKLTSKHKSVSWHKKSGKWQVHTSCNGVRYYGGLFDLEIDAAIKANELMLKHHGEFAVLNVI